jgi:S-adenosylmethionine-diacylgycerolhomoserine-N-methlytransferase
MARDSTTTDHAALMDGVYRRQRYIYDFTRKYYLFGRDRLIRELELRPGEKLVEIGCGTARNLIKIARRYPGTQMFGLDASHEMLKTAADSVSRAGLDSRIRLVHGYAENLSPEMFGDTGAFDRAVFSYSLSMIPDWRAALRAAGASLAENGRIHVVDFGDLTGMGALGARGLRAWLGLFHVEPRTEVLHGLENRINNPGRNGLWVSPARYAFLWTGTRDLALEFHP